MKIKYFCVISFLLLSLASVQAKVKPIWVYTEISSGDNVKKVVGRVLPYTFKKVLAGQSTKKFITMRDLHKITDDGLEKVENELAGNIGSFPVNRVSKILKIKGDPREYPLNDLFRLAEMEQKISKNDKMEDYHFFIDLKNKLFAGFGKTTTAKDVRKEFKGLSRVNDDGDTVFAYVYAIDGNSHLFRFDSKNRLLSVVLAGEKGEMSNGVKLGMAPDEVIEIMGKPILNSGTVVGGVNYQKHMYFNNGMSLILRFSKSKKGEVLKLAQIEAMF